MIGLTSVITDKVSFKDANITTIFKQKGGQSECGNYAGSPYWQQPVRSLHTSWTTLKSVSEKILPEMQAGFRPSQSTINMIFTLRQLQEKYREQHQPLYMAFIDLSKAFDPVSTMVCVLQSLDPMGKAQSYSQLHHSLHRRYCVDSGDNLWWLSTWYRYLPP